MLLLSFASLAQEEYDSLRTPSLLGRADSTELKNSILSVKKHVLNTRTRMCVHCARARILGAFSRALDV